MTQTKYQRAWYIRNKDRILSRNSARNEQKRKEKSQILVCPACKNKFTTYRAGVKYCNNPECKKAAEHNRYIKFKQNNKEHLQNYYKEYDMINKELRKITGRKGHLRRKYGITLDDYNRMFDEQVGRCAICGEESVELHVDHDHKTNKVRSLLCFHCNAGLGHFKENQDLLNVAIAYLILHK